MIPLQLCVRNFMCYRDNVPPLDFSGIHLACLTGANGHGKSALLDAMTWALWGKARAKRDDELIHLGESEMEVEFTFDLGGIVYRILRKRDSTKRGRSMLDIQVQSPGSDYFHSIAESTIRGTQKAIDRLLRMDYETFTNSAFLLQGKADAFTTRTPSERKKVLGEILNLSQYDDYEQLAKEKVREKDRQLAEMEGMLRDIDRELDRKPEYEVELIQARQSVSEASAALGEAEAELQTLRHEQQLLEHEQARLRDLERNLSQAQREAADIDAQIKTRQQGLKTYEATLAQEKEVQEGFAALTTVRQDKAAWDERLASHARLQKQRHELERTIETSRRQLDVDLARLSERLRELESRAQGLPKLSQELDAVQQQVQHLNQQQETRDQAQERLQALAEESAALQVRNEQMRADMDDIVEKIDWLKRDTGEAQCPLCGQALGESHRDDLLVQFEDDGRALGDAHRANTARRKTISGESQALQAEIHKLDRELSQASGLQRREAQLEQALDAAQRASQEQETVRTERQALEERLKAGDYALTEQSELAQRVEEMDALGYDEQAHQALRDQVTALAHFEAAYQQLQTARERVGEERAALRDLGERQSRWQTTLTEQQAQHQALSSKVSRLPQVAKQVQARAEQVSSLQNQASKARLALGAAQQKLDHCTYLAEERVRHQATRQQRAEEKVVFEELRLAFGKKGLQAMIIESVIPEIEFEANELLARMTDGRMHVRFETQRETLKGDTVETLDILISDELGTRAYDLFSGGEAFRVNFAIRIALSKLLARRAGTQLQMLVIDEGFGTQDAQGRARLVEAINSIQDDFERILVITHIEELKDAFPVRIEVTKTPEGSQIRLT